MGNLINEAKRMQLLAGLIKESQLNEENLPDVDDETIKNYIQKNIQPLLDQSEINQETGEIRIPLDSEALDPDPKSELEYNAFTKLYGVEYNTLMGTNQKDNATDKLEHITTLTNSILRDKYGIKKIVLVPIN